MTCAVYVVVLRWRSLEALKLAMVQNCGVAIRRQGVKYIQEGTFSRDALGFNHQLLPD